MCRGRPAAAHRSSAPDRPVAEGHHQSAQPPAGGRQPTTGATSPPLGGLDAARGRGGWSCSATWRLQQSFRLRKILGVDPEPGRDSRLAARSSGAVAARTSPVTLRLGRSTASPPTVNGVTTLRAFSLDQHERLRPRHSVQLRRCLGPGAQGPRDLRPDEHPPAGRDDPSESPHDASTSPRDNLYPLEPARVRSAERGPCPTPPTTVSRQRGRRSPPVSRKSSRASVRS